MDGMVAAPTKAIKPVVKSSSCISLTIGKNALRHGHIYDLDSYNNLDEISHERSNTDTRRKMHSR